MSRRNELINKKGCRLAPNRDGERSCVETLRLITSCKSNKTIIVSRLQTAQQYLWSWVYRVFRDISVLSFITARYVGESIKSCNYGVFLPRNNSRMRRLRLLSNAHVSLWCCLFTPLNHGRRIEPSSNLLSLPKKSPFVTKRTKKSGLTKWESFLLLLVLLYADMSQPVANSAGGKASCVWAGGATGF